MRRKVTVPDSVTTWVVEAVGVSNDYLMCVAEPVKLQVRPLFFLDLAMPYSVQRMEQIEIVVTVFNYADDVLRVSLTWKLRCGAPVSLLKPQGQFHRAA